MSFHLYSPLISTFFSSFIPTSLYFSPIYPHVLFCLLSFSQCQVLVVPSLQMAFSDHLLMTGEQRRAFPAAAAWHPTQCAHICTETHTDTYSHSDTHAVIAHPVTYADTRGELFYHSSPFCGVIRLRISLFYCQERFFAALLHPLPSSASLFLPPALFLSPPAVMLLTVTQEQTKKRQRVRGSENVRVVFKVLELANAIAMNVQ